MLAERPNNLQSPWFLTILQEARHDYLPQPTHRTSMLPFHHAADGRLDPLDHLREGRFVGVSI